MSEQRETYLGDGVFVSFDGFQIRLRTSNGKDTTNVIFLDPEVQIGLVERP